MAHTAQGALAPTRSTTQQSFCFCTQEAPLFAVRAGIPLVPALQLAQLQLAAARSIVQRMADDAGSDEMYGAARLIEMSEAVLASVVIAMELEVTP